MSWRSSRRDPKDEGAESEHGGTGYTTGAAPASDGECIVACFFPGLVVCYDLDGKRKWMRAILGENGKVAAAGNWATYAEVPVCVPPDGDGTASKVLVTFRREFRCFDTASGALLWRMAVPKPEACAAASPSMGNAGGGWYFMTVGGHVRSLKDGSKVLAADPPLWGGQCYAMAVDPAGKTLHSVGIAVRLPEKPDRTTTHALDTAHGAALAGTEKLKMPKDHVHVVGDSHAYSRARGSRWPRLPPSYRRGRHRNDARRGDG